MREASSFSGESFPVDAPSKREDLFEPTASVDGYAALVVTTPSTTCINQQQREQDYEEGGPQRYKHNYYPDRRRGTPAPGIQDRNQVAQAVVNIPRREDTAQQQRPPAARVNAPRANAGHGHLEEIRKRKPSIPRDRIVVAGRDD